MLNFGTYLFIKLLRGTENQRRSSEDNLISNVCIVIFSEGMEGIMHLKRIECWFFVLKSESEWTYREVSFVAI